ncbi:hypothetical protein ACO0LF_23790 [Undibacterium sp. Di27W]|uniref:hypothetical protein n=1 Tax=Undibacterium sp. Di27W TaxID=3413036 RepID=UPI003BF1EF6D
MDAEADADAAFFLDFLAFFAGLEASVDAAAAADAAGADALAEGADAWAKAVEANRPTTRAAINFFILVSFIKYWLRVIHLNQGQ